MRSSLQVFFSFLFGILIIFAGIYVSFSLDLSQWKKVGEVRLQLAERQAVVRRLNQLIQKFREQLAMFENLDKQIGLIGKALPTSLKIPELLVSLETIAQQNGVELQHISFTVLEEGTVETGGGQHEFSAVGERQKGQPYPILIVIDGNGNYLGTKKFLQGIENELRLIELKSLELFPLNKTGKTEEAGTFSFKLDLETYAIEKPQFTLP